MRRGPALRAGGVLTTCLCLTAAVAAPVFAAPATTGAPAAARQAGGELAGLPGPVAGCPGTHGIAAPAAPRGRSRRSASPASGR